MMKFSFFAFSFFLSATLVGNDVHVHGPIIQWHRDPTTEATFTWVQRLSASDMKLSTWQLGASGFGYGDNDDATELDTMLGNYKRVYIAKRIDLKAKPDADAKLFIDIEYDDAFVAFINGVEVARSKNLKESGEDGDVRGAHENEGAERFEIRNPDKILRAGPNLIAIEGHNRSRSSSDFSLAPELILNDAKLIEKHDKWLYLAGRDPEKKWYLSVPKVEEIEKAAEMLAANFRLFVAPRGSEGAASETELKYKSQPFGETANPVFSARIGGLKPDSAYRFRLEVDGKNIRTGWFRTAPAALTKPITFVVGGDMGTSSARPICTLAGRENVMFGYLGGDLAYANGRDALKWYDWIDNWTDLVTTADGRSVPMVAAIGNHEMKALVKKGDSIIKKKERAPYYFSLFDLPNEGNSNFTVDFGDYMSLVILDSNHAQKVGNQTDWLENQLEARRSVPHVFPTYHRPAWGTGVKGNIKDIQEEWTPLFEKYQVSCVFENDHHVYKRTHKITDGKRDDERGILHLGDGAWGANVRKITDAHLKKVGARDYLAHWSSVHHLIRVTVEPDGTRRYEAKTADGKVFDQFVDKP